MDIVPVCLHGRWIDDGQPIELSRDGGASRLRLVVAATGDAPTLAVLDVRRIDAEQLQASATIFLDLVTGEIRHERVTAGTFEAPLDLAWLRTRLDGGLREALRQRVERWQRARDMYDWMDGDRPRVALGDRASFAQLLPAAWDVIASLEGRRYMLVDSYRVAKDADERPVAIEIVDLETGESVGSTEIGVGHSPEAPRARGRVRGAITDRLLELVRQDADRWYELVDRSEKVARIARVMARWERDLRDPAAAVRAHLADPDDDEVAADRVRSLGIRAVPALLAALAGDDAGRSLGAARTLAEMGDAAGLDHLVSALADPRLRERGVDEHDEWRIIDALADLGARPLEPLLTAALAASDRAAEDRLFDALMAIETEGDVRVRDLLIERVRAEPQRAGLLASYGQADPAVIETLTDLARPALDALDANLTDEEAFTEVAPIAAALRELGAEVDELARFDDVARRRRDAARAAFLARRAPERPPAPPTPAMPPPPVRVAARPGRNEPCWCGNGQKYKKCHLDADDEARRPR